MCLSYVTEIVTVCQSLTWNNFSVMIKIDVDLKLIFMCKSFWHMSALERAFSYKICTISCSGGVRDHWFFVQGSVIIC